ncbi:UNVERIFIED_CONTAM: hypothetical protein FKN15_052750 [Acipenser sinensis]
MLKYIIVADAATKSLVIMAHMAMQFTAAHVIMLKQQKGQVQKRKDKMSKWKSKSNNEQDKRRWRKDNASKEKHKKESWKKKTQQ